jgi:hypothetical protein
MNMITEFENKKVAEYLEELPPGSRVLIRFGHGLGDTIMFYPLMPYLRSSFRQIEIDLYVECGQEKVFRSTVNKDDPNYDYIFCLNFPMSEGTNLMKVEKCCIEELGLKVLPNERFPKFPNYPNPIVALHYQGTALPGSVGCDENTAKLIWDEVIQANKVPLEVHFQHVFHNPVNEKFSFINSTVRGCLPDIQNLIGIIKNSFAFIGVASGPLVVALATIPEKTMYLEKNHPLKTYTRNKSVSKVNILPGEYIPGTIFEYLKRLDDAACSSDWRVV